MTSALMMFHGVTACTSQDDQGQSPQGERPATELLPAATVVIGLEPGNQREVIKLPAFEMAKYPVTQADYRKCVTDGACQSPPDAAECAGTTSLQGAADVTPAACVTAEMAQTYCQYVGGSLPSPEQWLYAARGTTPALFVGGDEAPNCEDTWRRAYDSSLADWCCDGQCDSDTMDAVWRRAAAKTGVRLLLHDQGALVGSSQLTRVAGCRQDAAGCLISGNRPGHIGAITTVAKNRTTANTTFRCAWSLQ